MKAAEFDIAVVGAGPAGAAAAITAARTGARVVLLEAGDFPRQKVCGEFVSAESLGLLSNLLQQHPRAWSIFDTAPILTRARLFLSGRIVQAPVSPAALSIPRYLLDLLLWEAAQQAGVCARSQCEVLSIEGEGPFTAITRDGSVAAKAIILCAGRWSRFSDKSALPTGPKWIGLKAHYREHSPTVSTDLYFFDHGYCGVQPVAQDLVNACALVRSDRARSLDEVFRLSPALARRVGGWEPMTQPVSTAPLLYRLPQAIRSNLLMAGDAAGFIDPFAGDGISIALRSGRVAAECLQSFLYGEVSLAVAALGYQREYDRQFAPLIAAASRVRGFLSLPNFARSLVFEMLRLPGVMPYVIRKTRTA